MRVIGGSAKGIRLKSPFGYSVRPTSDKVRESIFNILGGNLEHLYFLDLYAGTGAVGIEAISRGAGNVTFVDKRLTCIELIRTNLSKCDFMHNFEIIQYDVLEAVPSLANRQRRYDIIFIDPPYNSDLASETLHTVHKNKILKAGGRVIVEHSSRHQIEDSPLLFNFSRIKEYSFGDSALVLFENKE
ncbi:MAG: 16S rRNA (guanine(966)-N(2))-methyltransferase RsmD [bacterium]